MRTLSGISFLSAEIIRLLKINTKVVDIPSQNASLRLLDIAKVGHIPSTSTNTGLFVIPPQRVFSVSDILILCRPPVVVEVTDVNNRSVKVHSGICGPRPSVGGRARTG